MRRCWRREDVQGSQGPRYLKVTFNYELDSKEGPSRVVLLFSSISLNTDCRWRMIGTERPETVNTLCLVILQTISDKAGAGAGRPLTESPMSETGPWAHHQLQPIIQPKQVTATKVHKTEISFIIPSNNYVTPSSHYVTLLFKWDNSIQHSKILIELHPC